MQNKTESKPREKRARHKHEENMFIQGVPKKKGIKNFKFLTQYLGLQTVLRKVFVFKIKLRACTL